MLILKYRFSIICCFIVSCSVNAAELKIIEDKDVYRALPLRSMVENPEDKLFRSTDGKLLFFGPNDEKDFFIINPDFSYKHLTAPSTGKAYYANGAFQPGEDALQKLNTLSKLDIHSIEQPIRQGQIEEMEDLCCKTPLPIALDEELIGVFEKEKKEELITFIQPQ